MTDEQFDTLYQQMTKLFDRLDGLVDNVATKGQILEIKSVFTGVISKIENTHIRAVPQNLTALRHPELDSGSS